MDIHNLMDIPKQSYGIHSLDMGIQRDMDIRVEMTIKE